MAADLSKAGYQLLKEGNHAAARENLDEILTFEPHNSYALVGIGEVERRGGNHGAAMDAFDVCFRHDPDNRFALIGLADCYRA